MMKLLGVIILISTWSSLFCSSATIGHRVVRDVDDRDSDGLTALHRAARDGDLEAAENLIIQRHADVNAKTNNVFEATPLHLAAWEGHKDVVQLLLSHSADVDATDKFKGTMAIHMAASRGHKDVVELLLSHTADINVKFDNKATALHLAAWNGHKDVVELLLSHSADVDATDNRYGYTALHWAARGGHKDVVEVLLSHSAQVDAKDDDGKTALQIAEQKGFDGIVQLLKA